MHHGRRHSETRLPDRNRINIHEDYELRYWTKELGVTPEKLKQTVEKVGVMASEVRKALGKQPGVVVEA